MRGLLNAIKPYRKAVLSGVFLGAFATGAGLVFAKRPQGRVIQWQTKLR